jgi:hypothetical protein
MPHNLRAEDLLQQILNVAEEDGIISDDEQAMISSIKSNLAKYFEILDLNYEDGIITSEEQYEFYQARKKILEEALVIAREDEKITQDEFRIVQALRDVIRQIEEEEHY